MSSIDYSAFRKSRVLPSKLGELSFDVLLSAYNDSARVQTVFSEVGAAAKHWLVHCEYGYPTAEHPHGAAVSGADEPAIDYLDRCIRQAKLSPGMSLAVDITGMMRPHLLVLPLLLRAAGITNVSFLYSDPVGYSDGGATRFTKGPIEDVNVIPGLEGSHRVAVDAHDVLIIGAGYDHELVKAVAENKRLADHYLMVGLPALQPHMYQESVYRVSGASESIRDFRGRSLLFAPANDPFVTAQVLSDHVGGLRAAGRADNLYLAPVGPKTQVLGFGWYFLCEARRESASMIFPYASRYSRETSHGITGTSVFELELDAML